MVVEADAAASCRIVTWNVNGLKAAVRRVGSVQRLLESLKGDIVCLQETKVRHGDLERELAVVEGWHSFFSCFRGKTGYSGVATFCRASVTVPLAASEGLTGCLQPAAAPVLDDDNDHLEAHLPRERLQQLDAEGRAVVTDHGAFVLVNLYGPALTSEEAAEERMAFKLDFYKVLEVQVRRLRQAGREVVVVGDLNISPHPLDTCRPQDMNHTRPDRVWLNRLLPGGSGELVDVFRTFHPTREGAFTCWSTATGARVNNYGTRIDHILATAARGPGASPCPAWFSACDIWPEFQGSDHAPVWADVTPPSPLPRGAEPPALCTVHSFKGRQGSLRSWLGSAPQQQASTAAAAPAAAPSGASGAAEGAPAAGASRGDMRREGASTWPAAAAAAAAGGARQEVPVSAKRPAAAQHLLAGSGKPPAPSKKPRPTSQTSLLAFVSRPPAVPAPRPAPPPAVEPSASGRPHAACSSTQAASACTPAAAAHIPQPGGSATAVAASAATTTQQQPHAGGSGLSQQPFDPGPTAAPAPARGPQAPEPGSPRYPCAAPSAEPPLAPATHPREQNPSSILAAGPHQSLNRFLDASPVPAAGPAAWAPQRSSSGPGPLPPSAAPSVPCLEDSMEGGMPIVCSQYRASSSQHAAGRSSSSGGTRPDMPTTRPGSAAGAGDGRSAPACSSTGGAALPHSSPLPRLPASTAQPCSVPAYPSTGGTGNAPPSSAETPDGRCVSADPHRPAGASAGAASGPKAQPPGVQQEPAAAAWRRIAAAMKPPTCGGHKEPCVVRTVKKRGPNQGRQFYVCARPDGPPPVGRCDHFEWAGRRGPAGRPL